MKIPLKLGQDGQQSTAAAAAAAIARDVAAVKAGDWSAKNNLARAFHPLLTSLAEKRSHGETGKHNRYLDAGKEGLFKAARKHRAKSNGDNFQIFALDYIEAAMNRVDHGGGMLSRLFGK
jgi:DNA-directed RNA polymerase specialized sigma subunit